MALESPVTYGREMEVLAQLPPGDAQALLDERFPPASPEKAQAAEAVFAQEQEEQQVASLIGLWVGTVMLHDLAVEHLARPKEEDEEPLPRRPEKKDPEDR